MTLAQAYKKQFGKVSYPFMIYDSKGNITYSESSNGYWYTEESDSKGNKTYYEDSDGYWYTKEYDSKGNMTYFENSNGYWSKHEYDSNGNGTYYEDSDGTIKGKKQSSCDGKVVEIDGKKYKLKEL